MNRQLLFIVVIVGTSTIDSMPRAFADDHAQRIQQPFRTSTLPVPKRPLTAPAVDIDVVQVHRPQTAVKEQKNALTTLPHEFEALRHTPAIVHVALQTKTSSDSVPATLPSPTIESPAEPITQLPQAPPEFLGPQKEETSTPTANEVSTGYQMKPLGQVSVSMQLSSGASQPPPNVTGLCTEAILASTSFSHQPLRFEYSDAALGVCHNPVYFENRALERCARSCGLIDPVTSASHFVASVVATPVRMTLQPPNKKTCSHSLRRDCDLRTRPKREQ